MAALNLIRSAGGFVVNPAKPELITIYGMTATFWLKVHSLLVLFGADFFGIPAKSAIVPFAHLVAVVLVGYGVIRAVRRVFAEDDLGLQVLTVSFLVLLAAFFFGYRTGAREAVGLLPLGAVLAGRMLATRVSELKLVPALAAVLAFYGLTLARYEHRAASAARHATGIVAPGRSWRRTGRAAVGEVPRRWIHRARLAARQPAGLPKQPR